MTDPSEEELVAVYAAAEEVAAAPELPTVNEGVVRRAIALLAQRKIFDPSEQEFLDAVASVQDVRDETTGYLSGVRHERGAA